MLSAACLWLVEAGYGHLSIRDLKTFLLIAENGSFAGAARAIYRTQSAVTAQIQALEDELGVLLFDRTNRPPTLTEAARNFIPRAREVVNAYDALFRDPGKADFRGDLRLGVVPSVMTGLTPKFLVRLGERYPGLHVELAMGLSAELVSKVERGVLDAALISDPWEVDSSLNWSPFLREPLVLIAPIDAPQKSAKELLRIYPFMRYTNQAWVGKLIERVLAQKRFHVRETMVLNTLEAITAMVHAGLGVSVVPLRLVEPPGSPPVRAVPLPGPAVFRTLGLIEIAGHPKTTLSRTLLGALKDVVTPLRDGNAAESTSRTRARHATLKKNRN
jgi:DNA-binding transcriptional LysR family regulator